MRQKRGMLRKGGDGKLSVPNGHDLRANPENTQGRFSVASQPPMSLPIFTSIDARFPVYCHEHIAVLHRGEGSAARGLEFVSEGLSRGHRCCYHAAVDQRSAMRARLTKVGIDTQRRLRDHTLQFPSQALGSRDWLDRARAFFAEAEDARVPAARWLEEGLGTKPEAISKAQFFECHSYLNYLVKHYPSVALCQYDTRRLEIPHLFSAIAVHRHLFVENTMVRDNPFYIPAEKYVAMSPEDRERDLRSIFREVGFDLVKLLSTLAGYGQLQRPGLPGF
ncbi:MAG: MEDS domain-containing protein [Terriglobia bacterium]